MFLTASGKPAAMHGVCPHRYYPLALGRVVGETIQCNYHGFRFDGQTGACAQIPSQNEAPKAFRQRIYPVIIHGEWLWIWPGDPALADEALLPPLERAGWSENWTVLTGPTFLAEGRAQLLVENLLDLTHVGFLHATALEAEGLGAVDIQVREAPEGIYASRDGRGPWIEGFYDLVYGSRHRFEGLHDYKGGTWYYSPGYIRTWVEIAGIDDREVIDPEVFGSIYFQHLVTPATKGSVHYFSAVSRNYRRDDPEFDRTMIAVDAAVRQQDVDAIRLVEQQLNRPWTLVPELLSKADVGAIKVRRQIQGLLDREAAGRPKAS
jgi:vanillate O-demethylase monooxygenase subunit